MSSALRALGTVIYSLLFAASALNHISNFDKMTGITAQSLTKFQLQDLAVPIHAFATVLLVVGALGVLLGIWNNTLRKVGAISIILFLAGVTPSTHDFWNYPPNSMEQTLHQVNFFKNLSLLGAALIIYSIGSQPAAPKKKSQ